MSSHSNRAAKRLKTLVNSGVEYVAVNGKRRRICSINMCDTYARANGLCTKHLKENKKQQKPNGTISSSHRSSVCSTTEESVNNSNDLSDSATVPENQPQQCTSYGHDNLQRIQMQTNSTSQSHVLHSNSEPSVSSHDTVDISGSSITITPSGTSIDASIETQFNQDPAVNKNQCEYIIPLTEHCKCSSLASYKCTHCPLSFCLRHGLQHRRELQEEIHCLLAEAQEVYDQIPNLNINSGKENCVKQLNQWFQIFSTKINQKYYRILQQIDRLQGYIESSSNDWKTSLRSRMEIQIGCVLMEQLQNDEIDGLKFDQARDELVRAKGLFHTLSSESLISLSSIEDNQMNFNTPTLVIDDLKLIEDFCMESTVEIMEHSNLQQTCMEESTDDVIINEPNVMFTTSNQIINLLTQDNASMPNSTFEVVTNNKNQSTNNIIGKTTAFSLISSDDDIQNFTNLLDDNEIEEIYSRDSTPQPPHYRNYNLEKFIIDHKDYTKLDLSCRRLTDQDMEIIAYYLIRNNKTLIALNLEANQIGVQGAEHLSAALKSNRTLTTLNLAWNKMRAKGAAHLSAALKSNRTLTTLNLDGNQIEDEGVRHLSSALKSNMTLTTLHLSWNQIVAQGAEYLSDALKSNATLTTLNLKHNQIGDKGVEHLSDGLKSNMALNTLHLSWNQIGTEGTEHLSGVLKSNMTLTTLSLDGNQIEDDGVWHLSTALKSNMTLTTLNLSWNQIGAQGTEHLSNALKSNRTLTTLSLEVNEIGNTGAQHLRGALKFNSTLTSLHLSWNQIGDRGAEHLSNALKSNMILTTLSLDGNQIEDEGIRHLSDGIKSNRTLTVLNLSWNQIGVQGAEYLSAALKSHRTLSTLNLDGNQVADEGAEYLSSALKSNRTLTILNLDRNQIGTGGAVYLSGALKSNTTLTTLNLLNNEIDAKGAKYLSDALKSNTTLTTLNLEFSQIGSTMRQELDDALESNMQRSADFLSLLS